jgi:imidazolonepropionase
MSAHAQPRAAYGTGVAGLVLFRNARICTPRDTGRAAAGPAQGSVVTWDRGALLCRDGRIVTIGNEAAILGAIGSERSRTIDAEVDCGGRCMIPGFVDAHTHLCFLAGREREFEARLGGADYLEILRGGGGILASVAAVRAAAEEELFEATRRRALAALSHGTTTVEIKSGYGLSVEAELKQLRAIARVAQETPLSVVPTFLGAHAVPPEHAGATDAYVDILVSEMIPAAARAGARFCDVFCEEGVFGVAQARRILQAAAAAGLGLKLHADELHDTGGAALAAEMRAVSADHLLAASDDGLRRMAASGVIAVLLPATAFSMRRPYARARAMIDAGLPVALASDCNPGSSFTYSMPLVVALAVLAMGLTVPEALTAATLNAAWAVGDGQRAGSLTPGKAADFLLLEGETPAMLAFAAGTNPVHAVFRRGVLVSGTIESP